ncbi:MAG: hypothetical protein UH824_06040 [Acutalibacteraceae bacterium]|nr:hypothetical protein [Acutalibacteraceae bacterium]
MKRANYYVSRLYAASMYAKSLRLLWSQHVYWTRMFIISTVAELDDLNEVTDRLLRNPNDFARLFSPVFGSNAAAKFDELEAQAWKRADYMLCGIADCCK